MHVGTGKEKQSMRAKPLKRHAMHYEDEQKHRILAAFFVYLFKRLVAVLLLISMLLIIRSICF
jgi:hypothetical protein